MEINYELISTLMTMLYETTKIYVGILVLQIIKEEIIILNLYKFYFSIIGR